MAAFEGRFPKLEELPVRLPWNPLDECNEVFGLAGKLCEGGCVLEPNLLIFAIFLDIPGDCSVDLSALRLHGAEDDEGAIVQCDSDMPGFQRLLVPFQRPADLVPGRCSEEQLLEIITNPTQKHFLEYRDAEYARRMLHLLVEQVDAQIKGEEVDKKELDQARSDAFASCSERWGYFCQLVRAFIEE